MWGSIEAPTVIFILLSLWICVIRLFEFPDTYYVRHSWILNKPAYKYNFRCVFIGVIVYYVLNLAHNLSILVVNIILTSGILFLSSILICGWYIYFYYLCIKTIFYKDVDWNKLPVYNYYKE